ncbi:hypothetical protein HX116_09900 [Acinetobacter towneri]|uniref:hypothetical protein n=1 Tax=Acinetobacter towneri TaxID=202956 RepID=UPI002578E70E|nr:hypothetical protein [Acinetobacter towneri]MDM1731463.1 hypothetical protein [Acinetobacter towneri]MDM1734126.1 hypothetical protein [Acinetobacter towneri]MDM1739351.1 hypothetical protein [Acinetobacter towneri]MDM1742143.1 hypothetical protein [Acinetobacter towneri]MDM1744726.1 hypothetical protein [Acinetobacter towneri]
MENLKPIKQLPELKDNQEWACEGGCGDIQPVLHRNVYCERWDLSGRKIEEKAEHYYTCQNGHILAVWDTDANDYALLPDQAYQKREAHGLSLRAIQNLIDEIQAEKQRMIGGMSSEIREFFEFSKISFELTLKSGEVLSLDEHHLNELKASLTENMILGAE